MVELVFEIEDALGEGVGLRVGAGGRRVGDGTLSAQGLEFDLEFGRAVGRGVEAFLDLLVLPGQEGDLGFLLPDQGRVARTTGEQDGQHEADEQGTHGDRLEVRNGARTRVNYAENGSRTRSQASSAQA